MMQLYRMVKERLDLQHGQSPEPSLEAMKGNSHSLSAHLQPQGEYNAHHEALVQ